MMRLELGLAVSIESWLTPVCSVQYSTVCTVHTLGDPAGPGGLSLEGQGLLQMIDVQDGIRTALSKV